MYLEVSCISADDDAGKLGSYGGIEHVGHYTKVLAEGFCTLTEKHLSNRVLSYEMLSYHLHSWSEHEVENSDGDEVSYDMEMHVVFSGTDSTNDRLSVLGVFFNVDEDLTSSDDSDMVKSMINAFLDVDEDMSPLADFSQIYGEGELLYVYQGSLTTPNCAQTVNWHVLREVQNISQYGYDTLTNEFLIFSDGETEYNNRDLHDLNDRQVYCVSATTNSDDAPDFEGADILKFTGFISLLTLVLIPRF